MAYDRVVALIREHMATEGYLDKIEMNHISWVYVRTFGRDTVDIETNKVALRRGEVGRIFGARICIDQNLCDDAYNLVFESKCRLHFHPCENQHHKDYLGPADECHDKLCIIKNVMMS
jgi:hypothetical protein